MFHSKEEWIKSLQTKSIPFNKYGSFLPEQEEIFSEIYKFLSEPSKPILCISAPPASGKTHAICLMACYFSDIGKQTAIIVPNNYLKNEFILAKNEIKDDMDEINIITLFEYLTTDNIYDYVLIDEAHNIKSYLELDSNIVINFELNDKDEIYSNLIGRFLPPSHNFIAQQISHASAKEIIEYMDGENRYKQKIKPISDDPTAWLTFIYIWSKLDVIHLKFVHSEESFKIKLPNEVILMFSATPLTDDEIKFYCGIDPSEVTRASPIRSLSVWRKKQRLYMSILEEFSQVEKKELLKSLLLEIKARKLVLFNNFTSCIDAYNELREYVENIYMIPRNTENRMDIMEDYLNNDEGTLFTSSTVCWEGISIKGLKLVIIYDLPVPRSKILELMHDRKIDYKLEVLRRLEQGLGRVGRKRGEWGVGVALFNISSYVYDLPEIVSQSKLLLLRSWDALLTLHRIFNVNEVSVESFYE